MKIKLSHCLVTALCVIGLSGCKQGEGELCQIDNDCGDGLTCNEGTQRCQRPGGVFDASVAVDSAPRPDAPTLPADAAPPDAMMDAAVALDAAPTFE